MAEAGPNPRRETRPARERPWLRAGRTIAPERWPDMPAKTKRPEGQKTGVSKSAIATAIVVSYCKNRQYPIPVKEHEFAATRGRKWRFDLAFPAQRVAIEFEGGVWSGGRHTRGKGFIEDIEKYNTASLLGWCLIRCTYEQLEQGLLWNWLDDALLPFVLSI